MNTTKFKILLQVFLLVFVGGMFCSCQTKNALSEQTTQQEKSPQQVLKEQPIDDTHDAFLVDTGGKLGTLLITAELGEKVREDEFGGRNITFFVWNPAKMEQPIQTFSKEVMMGVAPEFHNVVDANFDGSQDFGYLFHRGLDPVDWYYWLWDEEQAQFIECKSLRQIPGPTFDAERKTVYGRERGGASSGDYTLYRWIDGDLKLLREIDIDYPKDDGTYQATVKDLIDGKMVEVYRTKWDSKDETGQLDERWYDLDYHGESKQQEKSPQQVLKEQPIDDTHDAFLVDTGGKLGTLLITVEVVGKREGDAGRQKTIFSVWNPKKMEQPIQTFLKKIIMGVAPEHYNVADANFDGYQDFGYLIDRGNQPNYWHYWLWDEKKTQFIYCEPLAKISDPQFDAEKKVVTGWVRDGVSNGEYTIYRWIDGELSLVRTIEFDGPTKDGMAIGIVKDLIDGKMVEVYRTEWDWKEETRQLDSKWFDLDYHGKAE